MCGIAGIISPTQINPSIVDEMIAALNHRGPDAQGTFVNDSRTIALGHTRLSIIDLSQAANQPFYSGNRQFVVVFNGEIYNFQQLKKELSSHHGTTFRTTSDTEVIAEGFAVWREKIAQKLEGMFSMAIVEIATGRVWLFRDRLGKKPLHYFLNQNLFAFASEIKSLLRHPTIRREVTLNRDVLGKFLHLGYIPEPETIYANIFKFPAGHYGEIDHRLQLKLASFWRPERHITSEKIRSPKAAIATLETLLSDAVTKRLISDVPLGTFLSGGTDSSLVTAIASRIAPAPVKTFSIGFQEDKFNESRYAREVARRLQTDHTEYVLAQQEAKDILEVYLNHFDEPFADTSAIPTMLVSKLARKEVKVVLTGDGGDELFQGYGAYAWADRLDRNAVRLLRGPMRWILRATGKSRYQRISHLLEPVRIGGLQSHIFSQEHYFFSQDEIKHKLLVDPDRFVAFNYCDASPTAAKLTPGEKQALFDLQYYLKDDLLVKVDRASMYHALECRSPLLDHSIVAFALSLHCDLKKSNGTSKWILKEMLAQYLPPDLIHRQKWGFSIPLASWLKGDLRYLVEDYLNDTTIEAIGLFDARYIKQLVAEFFGGKEYLYNRLWVLIVLHKWIKDNAA